MTAPKKTDTELELCNCDGFWHVEGKDGITRYISESSIKALIADHQTKLLQSLLEKKKTYSQVTYDFGTAMVVGKVEAVPTSVIEDAIKSVKGESV